jgi:hypothetical protein
MENHETFSSLGSLGFYSHISAFPYVQAGKTRQEFVLFRAAAARLATATSRYLLVVLA